MDLKDANHRGSHLGISSLRKFQTDYPDWKLQYSPEALLQDIYDRNAERWRPSTSPVTA